MRFLILTIFAVSLSACGINPTPKKTSEPTSAAQSKQKSTPSQEDLILAAEGKATPNARKVLFTLRTMIDKGEIIKGGCWDYLDTAFTRAGFPRKARKRAFDGKKEGGPYANPEQIQVGDWLYYINHSYGDVEHSGIFIDWVDEKNHEALILSYAGEHRQEPARYRVYDISHVYRIIRL